MASYNPSLALFKQAPIEEGIDKIEWIPYQPVGQLIKKSPIEFDISGTSTANLDLQKTTMKMCVKITKKDGKPITAYNLEKTSGDFVTMVDNSLHSIFQQVDVSFNQNLITTSLGCYYPYKAYFDTLLENTNDEIEGQLKGQLFEKDSYLPEEIEYGSNIGIVSRFEYTEKGRACYMQGNLKLDICQQERLIPNSVRVRIKLHQSGDSFRIIAGSKEEYELHVLDSKLYVCHVTVNPEVVVAQSEALKVQPFIYPLWKSDIRLLNIERGSFSWSMDDIYQGLIPSNLIIALCSSEAVNGGYSKYPFNFKTYNVNYIDVALNGVSAGNGPYQPNYTVNDYTEPLTSDK